MLRRLIFGAETTETLHKLYSLWSHRLKRGLDADANELLLFIVEEFEPNNIVENVMSSEALCSKCGYSQTTYDTQTAWHFYLTTESAALMEHVANKFQDTFGQCQRCLDQCTEQRKLLVMMDAVIIQVQR